MSDPQEARQHVVVVNDEEQYSTWPAGRELPAGWRSDGFTGSEEECLAHIEEVWTDMRPASLRRWILEQDQAGVD
jgi:MbtH protein